MNGSSNISVTHLFLLLNHDASANRSFRLCYFLRGALNFGVFFGDDVLLQCPASPKIPSKQTAWIDNEKVAQSPESLSSVTPATVVVLGLWFRLVSPINPAS
jgi:hypothetical protein